jgi:hypothetical protein
LTRSWTRIGFVTPVGIVDAGPLIAAADVDSADHIGAIRALQTAGLALVIPALVVAEATHLILKYLGVENEARFVEGLRNFHIEAPNAEDLTRMAALIRQYAGFPLGAADASVVALAERLDTDIIITLDRRHFRAIRPAHCESFRLLPG